MIRTIIFDLGKVLIPFDWQRGYQALAAYSPYPPEEIRARIKATNLFDSFERGKMQPEEVARKITEMLHLNGLSFPQFREVWSSIFLPETLLPDEMLGGLHQGHRLLLLSNTDAIHYAWVAEKYPILRHFDGAVLSFEVGSRKPEPAIYQAAIERAGCAPGEIFFTDDLEANVEGARRMGIDAVTFQNREQLEQELHARGVRW
ncbi:MAG: HAD family phosphatase [Bryobacteraceae bacterium]|nr:HAD family phosphatase [Bryobacteraceae bacterium]